MIVAQEFGMPWYGSGGAVLVVALVLLYLAYVVGKIRRRRK